jgi:D-inositol-3-phosphate glycosyltransferase
MVPIKRVAMLSVHTCPLAMLGGKETGGMNVYVRDLALEFSRRGITVDVFTRSQNAHLPHVMHQLGPNGRVIHIPTGPEEPYDKNKVFDYLPDFVAGVKQFAEDEGVEYDVIHSHYWLSGWAARELREEWRVPIVQMFHTLGKMKDAVAQRPGERETVRRIEVETEIVQFADRLVAATPAERDQLIKLYGADPGRISIVPPGVDIGHFHPLPKRLARQQIGADDRDWLVLFVGRIEPLKGVDTLIRAMALLAHKCPTWVRRLSLAIIGGDPSTNENAEMERLKAMHAELQLGDLVVFLGAKDQNKLQYYYNAAEALVMPSHYESFGLVALEAMACGTPVIASDVGGLSHLVRNGKTGFHVPSGDHLALASTLSRLLQDDALRRKLGEQAADWAQNFSWAKIGDRVLTVYRRALAGGAPTFGGVRSRGRWTLCPSSITPEG